VNAQGDGSKRENIESMKIAHLTKKLNLTPDEAQKFWPVFNQFSSELDAVKSKRKKVIRNTKEDFDQLSDKDVEKVVDGDLVFRQQELDIVKKYHNQFKQVLPIKKVAMLYRAEDDFKRELLEKIKERRGMNK
jgi:enoyl reductase-like protein